MAERLISLAAVPDDEAYAIREALHDAGVDYYETPPGNYRESMAAIWVNGTAEEIARARSIIEEQQRAWRQMNMSSFRSNTGPPTSLVLLGLLAVLLLVLLLAKA